MPRAPFIVIEEAPLTEGTLLLMLLVLAALLYTALLDIDDTVTGDDGTGDGDGDACDSAAGVPCSFDGIVAFVHDGGRAGNISRKTSV